jgi:hypothetical protein
LVLLDDRFAPITSVIGFLEAELGDVTEALRRWRAELHGSATATELPGGLEATVHRLEPLTAGVRPRELLVTTRAPGWTAVFDCGHRGGTQTATLGYLCDVMLCRGLVVNLVPPAAGPASRYGAVQFALFGPVRTEFINYVRTVSLIQDGSRWEFSAHGTAQDYEQVAAYSARRVRDRFTPKMLTEYCAALGLEPFDAGFYPGPSVLVESPQAILPGLAALSLADVQKRDGIRAASEL